MPRIDKNSPSQPVIAGNSVIATGIPIRLELAARFMQGILSSDTELTGDDTIQFLAKQSLRMADALVNAYNQQEDNK